MFADDFDDFYESPLNIEPHVFPGRPTDISDLPPIDCFALPTSTFPDLHYVTSIVIDQAWANSTWANGVVRNFVLPVGVSVLSFDTTKMDQKGLVRATKKEKKGKQRKKKKKERKKRFDNVDRGRDTAQENGGGVEGRLRA
jgi:hypothetical protein